MSKPVTSSASTKKPATRAASTRARKPASERALTTAQNATRREVAAYWLAIGVPQKRAADECGVDLRTVQRWCAEPDFQEHLAELRLQAFREIQPQMLANVRLALDVERRMLNGEVKADDPAWLAAREVIQRFERVAVRPRAAGDAPAGGGQSVHVHVGPASEPERPSRRVGGDVIEAAG